MMLRKKIFFVVACVVSVSVIAFYLLIDVFFFHSLNGIEEANVKKNSLLVGAMIEDDSKSLGRQILDWSRWDDLYEFADAPTEEFVESNLLPEALVNLGINFIVIADRYGKVLAEKGVNLETGESIPVPSEIGKKLQEGSVLTKFSSESDSYSGIVLLSSGPVLLATSPIVTSFGEGPARGTIAFAKIIDEKYTRTISDFLKSPVTFAFLGSRNFPPDFSESAKNLPSSKESWVKVEGSTIFGYGFVPDVFGSPLLFYRFEGVVPDFVGDFYFVTGLLFLGFFIVVSFSIFQILAWTVPSRIADLSSGLAHIREVGSSGLPLSLSGKDELTALADEINVMLQNMFRIREQSDIAERRFDTISDTIPAVVWMIGKEAHCLYVNKRAVLFIGESGKDRFTEEWNSHIHPDDVSSCVLHCAKAFEERKPITMEYRISSMDGGYRWVLDNGVPHYSSPGVFLGFLHVAIDITDQKTTEEVEVNKRKEAERLNAIMVSRELRMIELKKEIRVLRDTFKKSGLDESDKK